MRTALSLLSAMMTAAALSSGPVAAAEFQFDTPGGAPFYQSPLTLDIYQFSQRDGLQDLAVTNAAGEQLPYTLLPYEEAYSQSRITTETRALPMFAIHESRLENPDGLRLELEKPSGKTTLSLVSDGEPQRDRTVLLIDAGREHPPLQQLTLDWEGHESQWIELEVLVSDDLRSWSHAGHAVLLKTAQNGRMLMQNSIELTASTQARYLQIRPTGSAEIAPINWTGVNAGYRNTRTETPPKLWEKLSESQRDESEPDRINIDFEARGHYPASHLRVTLPQENTVTFVTVLTRNRNDAPWTVIAQAPVYRLVQDGKSSANPDLVIAPTVARYWRLQFTHAGGGIGTQNPELSLGWVPPVLVWNARGTAPYTLHVGEGHDVARLPIHRLIPDFKPEKVRELPKAGLSGLKVEQQPQSTWVQPIDYKHWLLWGGLVLGVLLLAAMAYSLLKTQPKE